MARALSQANCSQMMLLLSKTLAASAIRVRFAWTRTAAESDALSRERDGNLKRCGRELPWHYDISLRSVQNIHGVLYEVTVSCVNGEFQIVEEEKMKCRGFLELAVVGCFAV